MAVLSWHSRLFVPPCAVLNENATGLCDWEEVERPHWVRLTVVYVYNPVCATARLNINTNKQRLDCNKLNNGCKLQHPSHAPVPLKSPVPLTCSGTPHTQRHPSRDALGVGQPLWPSSDGDSPHRALPGLGPLGCWVVVADEDALKRAKDDQGVGLGGSATQREPISSNLRQVQKPVQYSSPGVV